MMRYKRTTKSLAEIGRELGADYLVESSIRAESGRLRITSKLIRVRDQVQVWSESYDREPTSMLGLQRELSTVIAQQVRLRLSPERLDALARRQTRNPEAYDSISAAGTSRTSARRHDKSARSSTTSVRPRSIRTMPSRGHASPDALPRVRSTAMRRSTCGSRPGGGRTCGTRRSPISPRRSSPGMANFCSTGTGRPRRRPSGARSRSIPATPRRTCSRARPLANGAPRRSGSGDAPRARARAAQSDRPRDVVAGRLPGPRLFPRRVEHARQAIVVDPEFWIGHMMLGQAYEQLGQTDLALEAFTNAARFSGGNSKAISLRGYVLAKAGRRREAREMLKTLETVSRQRYVPPYALALVHAGLGEREAVFEWLDRAYAARDVHLIFLPVDPKWDPYRADPRFVALLARCGFMRTARPAAPTQ